MPSWPTVVLMSSGPARTKRKRDGLRTLYIRLPARASSEQALCRHALVADGGVIEQQGQTPLAQLGPLVANSRVVLLLAASDVTLLHLPVPPLSGARLRAALPGLVEEHILEDAQACVLVAGPAQEGGQRTVAVTDQAWLTAQVGTLHAMGARQVSAVPTQLCLPLIEGNVSAYFGDGQLALRQGEFAGLGMALDGDAAVAVQTARVLSGDASMVLYVEQEQIGAVQALLAEADPASMTLEPAAWAHWIAAARAVRLDLVPALGAAGVARRDWSRWRWPLALVALALVVNIVGLNLDWLRLQRESDAVRRQLTQTFRSVYPNQPVVDPVAQMRQNIARAQTDSGVAGPNDFTWVAAAFGEAMRSLPTQPAIVSMSYRERMLTVSVKPETLEPASVNGLKAALAARRLSLEETAAATWQIRSLTGAAPAGEAR